METGILLQDRVALVTGASRGIGAATAMLLAAHGAAVAVNYNRSRERAQEVVDQITVAGGRAIAVRADIGDAEAIGSMVQETTAALGPIDTLVLNASAEQHFTVAPFTEMTWEQYEDLVTGETKAVFLPAKAVVPSMVEQRRGCIVAVSSGLSRNARTGMSAHSSGKAAVDALVRSLAVELGPHNIRVNAVAPGLVQTEASASVWGDQTSNPIPAMLQNIPLRRIATPEDVAGAILMLAADASRFITGMYLPVSGGLQMV